MSRILDWLDRKLAANVATDTVIGFPVDCGDAIRAALLAAYGGQFASYVTLLWQVPALSLTAQAFLFTIVFGKDASDPARLATGLLSVLTSAMSIYLMISHRIHAERQGRIAADLARQLGAVDANDGHHRGAVGVWLGVNRGSFALWLAGVSLFGLVGLGAATANFLKLFGW